MLYADVICHRESHLLPARLSATPGSWSGHSVKLQKEFLKLRPQEDISSIYRIEVYPSQVITPGQAKAWLRVRLRRVGGRGAQFLLFCSSSVLTVVSQASALACVLGS